MLPGPGIVLEPQGICRTSKNKTQKYALGQYFQFHSSVSHSVHTNPETTHWKHGCESHRIQTSTGRAMTCSFFCQSHPDPTGQSCTSSAVATWDGTVRTTTRTRPTLGNTVRFNSLQNSPPGTNVIKAQWVSDTCFEPRQVFYSSTANSIWHIDGCSSWPHESKRNRDNAQGTKLKPGTLDTKHKSTCLLQKGFKLISRIVWKVAAVNINAFTAHSLSLSHLNWVQIYFPLSSYFSHMLNKCKYFTLSAFKKRMWFKSLTQCWCCSLNSVYLPKSFTNPLNKVSVWPQQTGNFQMPPHEVFLKGYNESVQQQPCFLHS